MVAFENDDWEFLFLPPLGGKVKVAAWELVKRAFLIRRCKMLFDFFVPKSIAIGQANPP